MDPIKQPTSIWSHNPERPLTIPLQMWEEISPLEKRQLTWGMDENNRNWFIEDWKKTNPQLHHSCAWCGKESSISYKEPLGEVNSYLRQGGWSVKCAVMYTNKNDWFLFCSDGCKKSGMEKYFQDNKVSTETREKVKETVQNIEKDIPKSAKQIAQQMESLVGNFQKIIKKDTV